MRQLALMAASIVALMGCMATSSWQQPKHIVKSVHALQSWTVTGVVAAKDPAHTFSATLYWQQLDQQNYIIRLFGPLGSSSVIIQKHNGVVQYQNGKQQQRLNNHALPIDALFYWMRGLPAPGTNVTHYDHDHKLIVLKQGIYVIYYEKYMRVNGLNLPAYIRVVTQDSMLKLVIKQWRF